ncbi:hypothetical protein ACFSKN_10515 [Mariniflexile gromovii]|uniref:Transmembrane protein n=1 Tax=Mariniflexile gromovii TaxID=362523 RepID=A0ABS4BXH3_9FLAO|nr:hypothetical protein [Mariniflexile gromovii]MBP0904706.1 hypothetical protein [Mariniflexile gromovii]
MDRILKSISFIFHPLFMPLAGVGFYFYISPRFTPGEIIYAKLISLAILTIILPVLIYFLLKTLGKIQTVYLRTTNERILPLALNCVIILIVMLRILVQSQFEELYFFFVGILISTITCLILAIFQFKASIHMIAISGLFMFFIALSIHFNININDILALMCIINGAIATSRLHVKAHTYIELIMGFFVGVLPQLILVNYWL